MIHDALQWLQHSSLAGAVRGDEGWEWLFPIVETLHVISISVVVGCVLMIDLRLLGVSERGRPVSRLSAEVLPLTWIAFICALSTGGLMFISKAQTYFGNLQFECKMALIAIAGINMLVFHMGIYRRVAQWDSGGIPSAARAAGAVSIAVWIGVVFLGRWIGFTT